VTKTFDDSTYLGARVKPKQNKIELELQLDTQTKNYSKIKGEQISLNVDGKPTYAVPSVKQTAKEQPKYFNSSTMDKIVYTSTNATLGQMNRLYHLGYLKDNKLHLTSVRSILQMKPSFEYFDIYEKKIKDLKEATSKTGDMTGYYFCDLKQINF
jgi:DNA-directed RNA polymerase-3 subunit RPC5